MSESNTRNPGSKEAKLPRRDWILLPLVSLLTVGITVVTVELIARRIFSSNSAESSYARCFIMDDPSTGVRAVPNSVCSEKPLEVQQVVEYRFNSCGHRAAMECGLKPSGTYKIVGVGASFAMGMRVPIESTITELLPRELSRQTGRKIELYNESMHTGTPHSVALRFNEVLAENPDMIFWMLSPWDVEHVSLVLPEGVPPQALVMNAAGTNDSAGSQPGVWRKLTAEFTKHSILDAMSDSWDRSRTKFMLQHFLCQSQSQYVKLSLMRGDDDAGFLKAEPSTAWQERLKEFDTYAANIEGRAGAKGIPFVAVLLPNRVQAAMISRGEWPADYDPYKLEAEVHAIIVKHGGMVIDILPDFRNIPNSEQYYLPVDGHPDADGHAIISRLLVKALTSGSVPALRVAAQPQTALNRER